MTKSKSKPHRPNVNSAKSFGLNRREFVLYSSAAIGVAAASWYLPDLLRSSPTTSFGGTIVGGGRGVQDNKDIKYLALLDTRDAHAHSHFLPLDFQPHGIARHPLQPHIITVFEKKGPGACEVDLLTKQKTRVITTLSNRHFYGHGVYSKNGDKLYATETILASREGVIAVRDARTLRLEGVFPTYGANPHECHLIEDGRVIAITNGGGPPGSGGTPCVTYVDLDSQKLISKYVMQDEHFNTGHMQISKNKDLVVVSAPREGLPEDQLGAISVLTDGALQPLREPRDIIAGLKAETLSVCIDEARGVFGVTSPRGNMVSFWSLKTKKLLSSLSLLNPRGIVLNKQNNLYAISHDLDGGVLLVNAQTLKPLYTARINKAGFSGSHLYLI